MKNLIIVNPKRQPDSKIANGGIYPFYPGFTENFARSLLQSSGIDKNATVMDPWNGSGTTTTAAAKLGIGSQGFDLNPVMVIAAKARQNVGIVREDFQRFVLKIIKHASRVRLTTVDRDPLTTWFRSESACRLRQIEQAIQLNFLSHIIRQPLAIRSTYGGVPDLMAFYYTVLFRTIRALLTDFSASNPTWIKKPKTLAQRLNPGKGVIDSRFEEEAGAMIYYLGAEPTVVNSLRPAYIDVASSDSLPLPDRSVDVVLTSPPYCTRIDYAVATAPELAILGYNKDIISETLRRKLIGTSTVKFKVSPPDDNWGATCLRFLKQMASHESKASKTYYYKNHVQYFQAIHESISEIYRCLKKTGVAFIVVQDSYYKELHNDLPQIFIEMASTNRLKLKRRADFPFTRTMARLHPGIKNYRKEYGGVESVLCFTK